jgi:hypothetical protein
LSTPATTAAPKGGDPPTIRGLIARHPLAASATAAGIAVMLALILIPLFGAKAGAVSDSTTCAQWGSANQKQQAAYAQLYLREHGPLQGGGDSASSVLTAINDGCAQAFGDDVSDTTTVVQAITGRF